MAFTSVEMAILSQSAYIKPYPAGAENKSLYDFLNENRNAIIKDKLGDGYADAFDTLLVKIKDQPYTIIKSCDDKYGTGFAAYAIKDPDNNVTVACRGTEGFDLSKDNSRRDVLADAELISSLQTTQQAVMKEFIEDLERRSGADGYYFTGHSLGGNLAMYGAIMLSDPDKVKGAEVFNAPGFNSRFRLKYKSRISDVDDKITCYQNEHDCVSDCFESPGKIVIVKDKIKDRIGFQAHGMENLVVDGDGFKKNKSGKKGMTVGGTIAKIVTSDPKDIQTMFELLPFVVLVDFTIWSVRAVSKFVFKHSKGYQEANNNPYIAVETDKLMDYCARLQAANRRIASLDMRLDSLYWKVGLLDIWDLLQADILTSYSIKLLLCANALMQTANDFKELENELSSCY